MVISLDVRRGARKLLETNWRSWGTPTMNFLTVSFEDRALSKDGNMGNNQG